MNQVMASGLGAVLAARPKQIRTNWEYEIPGVGIVCWATHYGNELILLDWSGTLDALKSSSLDAYRVLHFQAAQFFKQVGRERGGDMPAILPMRVPKAGEMPAGLGTLFRMHVGGVMGYCVIPDQIKVGDWQKQCHRVR